MNSKTGRQYKRARITSLVLLFLPGFSALLPAVLMIMDPSGSYMQLPAEVLMGIFSIALTLPYYMVAFLLLGCGMVMKLSKNGLS